MSRPEFHNIQEQAGKADEKWDDNADLITEETMKVGGIHWHIYIIYAKAASYRCAILVPILFGVIQCCQIGANTWLENWVQISDITIHSISYFMGIYAILITSYILLFACTSHIALTTAAIRASERLHDSLLNNVLRLPMSFFDTTPAGRIVNRFSSDFFNIDVLIPFFILEALKCGVSALGSIIVISVTTLIFLVVVPPIVSIFIALQLYYTAASRSFRRIESTAMSPFHQHFFETLSGVSTIRALQCDERFIEQNASRADQASNAQFVRNIGERWLTVRLEALGSAIVLMASLFAVLGRNSLSPSMVGMSLSYALNITQDITYLIQSMCDVQFQMVSLERIDDYCNKSQEAPNFTDVQLPESWPSQGRISFKNYSTRYRQGVDLVLKNISFEVQPGEKVGIVGRTGAGKSSLTLALFRIIEAANSHWAKSSHNGPAADSGPSKTDIDAIDQEKVLVEEEEDGGSIWIDGVDISTVGLEHLRQRLAIIPQEPTLFEGTVRDNLDPFQQASDAEVWEAMELAHLKGYISSLTGGLYFQVTRNGENFSVGQRSLVCLARALLRKTKVLVLDEATASVDVETDDLIQKTIRKEFKDRTILTIAHRIKTVMDSDRILVLDKGRVQEYEAPSELLKRKESMFYRLAKQANEI
ncbi:Multidrug resistance-associated protein 1 [Haplosporangium bisporale]|nr:Multidrug resistance-associated protein 1 [Haplosporangium bisporale]